MKQRFLLSLLLLLIAPKLNAQQICMVGADFDEGTNYLVAWYDPWDPLYDSVFVYKKTQGQALFYKIGAKSVNELNFYVDSNANTMEETYYKISYLDTNGVETPLSMYHKPVVLDYMGPSPGGTVTWTQYEIEDEVDQTYIWSYKLFKDNLGLGEFAYVASWPGGQTGTNSWYDYDTSAVFSPFFKYYMETSFAYCSITKANINTSRSNIKQQFSNSEAGVEENKNDVLYLMPNPMTDVLNVLCNFEFVGEEYTIIAPNGQVAKEGKLENPTLQLNLSDFEQGQYLFVVSKGKKMYAKPFIKH